MATNRIDPATITALVLAGGAGKRMGGVDKGLVDFHGQPLAWRALQRLSASAGQCLLSANRNVECYRQWGVRVISDQFHDAHTGYAGPLAGIAAGLACTTTEWLLIAPCDMPFLPVSLGQRLGATSARLSVAYGAGRIQPLLALLHVSLAQDVQAYLEQGGRTVQTWQARHQPAITSFIEAEAFANYNQLSDG